MAHPFNPGSAVPDICCTNGCGKPASDAIHLPGPQFPVGSSVCHRAFTDCFKKQHEAVPGLTVIESKYVNTDSIAPYYRIKAVGPDGRGYVEAAERFFDAEQCPFEDLMGQLYPF